MGASPDGPRQERHWVVRPRLSGLAKGDQAGSWGIDTKMAMIATTTSSSIRVNPTGLTRPALTLASLNLTIMRTLMVVFRIRRARGADVTVE